MIVISLHPEQSERVDSKTEIVCDNKTGFIIIPNANHDYCRTTVSCMVIMETLVSLLAVLAILTINLINQSNPNSTKIAYI